MLDSLLAAGASLIGGSMTNSANKKVAREQMAFQERMARNSYQYAVQDMEAAGLNPMLAYSQGGASTPSGASAPQSDVITPAVNTALAARKNQAEVDNMTQTNKNLVAQEENTKASTAATVLQGLKSKADTKVSNATAAKIGASLPEADVQSNIWKAIGSFVNPASAGAAKAGHTATKDGGLLSEIWDRATNPAKRKH